jgi:hypothetical protein
LGSNGGRSMGLETGEKEVYSILAVYCIGFYMGYMGLLMSVSGRKNTESCCQIQCSEICTLISKILQHYRQLTP